MNTNKLYIEYARVIEMCKGTALENKTWKCVKFKGNKESPFEGHPYLKNEGYMFAVAILEDKPVFVKPKRTFNLNGVELTCPDNNERYSLIIGVGEVGYTGYDPVRKFNFSKDDASKVYNTLCDILDAAKNNE